MQSVPTYHPPNFPPTSPYPNTTSAATNAPSGTASADSTGDGTAAAMSVPTPPVMTSTLGQNLMETDSAPPAEPTKRNQVKNACTNCQKACKKCDDARPCPRCEKYGIADTCVNSIRKERKKGIKRGPYKRRQKNDDKNQDQAKEQAPAPPAAPAPPTVTVLRPAPPPTDFGYPTQLSQYQNYETYNYAINAAAAVYNSNNPNNPHPLPVYSTYPAPVLVNGDNTTTNNNANKDNTTSTDTNGKNDPTSARILATLMTTNPSYLQAMNGIISTATTGSFAPSSTTEATTSDASKKPEEGAKQPTTPVPGTSNSSGTTSPSVAHEDDEKFARLSQLCSAALRENKEAQEKKTAEGTTAAAATEGTEATTTEASDSTAAPAKQDEEMTEAQ